MVQRCENPKLEHWERYGGRGIAVCARWRASVVNFVEDMGLPPNGHTLDRIDNDGNYEPGNCRWATRREQSNNRHDNRMLTFNGRRQTVAEWSRELGLPRKTIDKRLATGRSVSEALSMNRLQRRD